MKERKINPRFHLTMITFIFTVDLSTAPCSPVSRWKSKKEKKISSYTYSGRHIQTIQHLSLSHIRYSRLLSLSLSPSLFNTHIHIHSLCLIISTVLTLSFSHLLSHTDILSPLSLALPLSLSHTLSLCFLHIFPFLSLSLSCSVCFLFFFRLQAFYV